MKDRRKERRKKGGIKSLFDVFVVLPVFIQCWDITNVAYSTLFLFSCLYGDRVTATKSLFLFSCKGYKTTCCLASMDKTTFFC